MPVVYRLVASHYAHNAFDGYGAKVSGGRWNTEGVAVAYGSDSVSLAALEILVHTHHPAMLANYLLCSVELPDQSVLILEEDSLPPDWQSDPVPESTQRIGDGWVAGKASLALTVPSTIIPMQRNYLINPEHPDYAALVRRVRQEPFKFDPRLVRL